MIPQSDTVIFLGAGFSYDAGLPLMSDFGPKSLEDYNGLQKHLSGKDKRDAAKMLLDAADVFYDFQNYCLRSPTVTSVDADNLETVFCIAEAMKEAGLETIPLQNTDYPLNRLIEDIQMWLWKIYQQCPIMNDQKNPRKNKRKDTYREFFRLLSEKFIGKRTIVISTNYDLIFEYMALEKGTACSYPFKNLLDHVKPIKVGNGSTTFVRLNQDDPDVHFVLCKLHGSVNFFEYSSDDESYKLCNNKLFAANYLGGDESIGKSGSFYNKPAIFAVDAISEIYKKYDRSLTPAIIPPTYAKLVGKEWLREIWFHAFDALSMANAIVFIGYSMPQTDGFMRALIHAAFAKRTQTNKPYIFVIDPSLQVHQNYYALFGASYRDIGRHTLEWALKTDVLEQAIEIAIKQSA